MSDILEMYPVEPKCLQTKISEIHEAGGRVLHVVPRELEITQHDRFSAVGSLHPVVTKYSLFYLKDYSPLVTVTNYVPGLSETAREEIQRHFSKTKVKPR